MNGLFVSKLDGTKRWYKDGMLHREDGPAVESLHCRIWFMNGRQHRDGGPSIIQRYNEDLVKLIWYHHGSISRLDGPAIQLVVATLETVESLNKLEIRMKQWYVNDQPVQESHYLNWLTDNGMAIDNLSKDDKQFINLAYRVAMRY